MMFARALGISLPAWRRRLYSRTSKSGEYGVPLRPSWSVTELLSSYSKPTISSETLTHLHELAALTPPAEGTPEHAKLKEDMSELVRLVEAVKLVDTREALVAPRWDKEDADSFNIQVPPDGDSRGQALLKHAARTKDGFYLVDTDRNKTPA